MKQKSQIFKKTFSPRENFSCSFCSDPFSGERMKIFPLVQGGSQGRGHRSGGCDLLMTSLLLLTLGTLLLPSSVSGATQSGYYIESCYSGQSRFKNESTCSFEHDWVEGCCLFIFSFGDVSSTWTCISGYGSQLDPCEGEDNSCTRLKGDPSGRSIRCVCTTKDCNGPEHWDKDPVFKQWNNLPGNRKEGRPNTAGVREVGSGGVARRGDSALLTLSLVSAALLSRRLSAPASCVLLTLGATFLLLPSTVSGEPEFQTAKDLTCLSSSNATDHWEDRHCGAKIETCCYYIFREFPNWGCASPSSCEKVKGDLGETVCKEQFDGVDRPPALVCHCNRRSCNHDDEWVEDPLFQQWSKERKGTQGTQGTTPPTTKGPGLNSGSGTKDNWLTGLALLKALLAIIF